MPNKPTPLEISFEKLGLRVIYFSFFLVSFSRGCPGCNIADVNQCEKRCTERKWNGSDRADPCSRGRVVYVNKVRDRV